MYQYRVTVNQAIGPVCEHVPANWGQIAQTLEERGGYAKLERRNVEDRAGMEDILSDPDMAQYWTCLGKICFSPWEIFAELDYVTQPDKRSQ